MEALQIKVTEYEVTVTGKPQRINAGNVEYIKCEFDLDEAFTDYTVRASFNGNYRLVENGECYVPILEEGECEIRVYGCILDGNVYETVISPKPTKIIVGKGSFNPDDVEASEIPATEAEQLERIINGKQDKLTAGTGITIENNVISATGGGGSVDFDDTITQDAQTGKYGIDFAEVSSAGYSEGKAISGAQANELLRNLVNLIGTKQDTLTADQGVKIVNNVISATQSKKEIPLTSAGFKFIEDLELGWYYVTHPGKLSVKNGSNRKSLFLQEGDVFYLMRNTTDGYMMTGTNQGIPFYVDYTMDRWLDGNCVTRDIINTLLSNYLTTTEVNTALEGKQDVRTEVNITDSTLTALTIAKDTDYVFKTLVGTMAFSLASTFTSGRSTLTFTTGDTPNVTLDSDDMPEKWHGEEITTFEANTTYELDLRVVTLPVYDSVNDEVVQTPTLIIAGGAVTEAI